MAILDTDIKLMASERLTDDDDGGGMMSAVEVQDGVVNNLFPDISRLNRTYGRVDLRKCYAAVLTANQDIYYGSHVIVTDTPDDPRVSVMMFTTGSYTDERAAAQNHIESYVVKGPVSDYTLLGDQLEGQRMVKVYSRIDAKLPEIGQVYMLSLEDEDGESTGGFQYIRVTTIEHEILEFEDDKGIYQRRVITLGIGSALRETFAGPQTASRYSAVETDTVFRTTQVADASKYYGQVKVSEAISNSPMSIKLDSIYGQLVPSATVESPVANVAAGVERLNIVAAGAPYSITTANASTFSFGRAITEGSVTVNYGGRATYEDDGNGALICTYTTSSSYGVVGAQNGSIDYESGTVTGFSVGGSYTITMTATPAAAIYDTAHTDHEKIELINRGYNYVKTLRPMPQPGTLFVDYMAQGEWYRMQDNGSGVLEDEAGGAGTIDYATGTVVVTLGALPDTDSEVIYTWASPSHYEIRTADPDIETGYLYFTVSAGEFLPNSLSFNYDAGGVVRTVTDDGSGNLTGDGTGHVIYGLGQVGLKPTYLPDSDSVLTINYDKGTIQQETLTSYGMSGDDATFTVAGKPIKPGTFAAKFNQDWDWERDSPYSSDKHNTGTREVTVSDNGDGTLSNGGTINYISGAVSMPVNYSNSNSKQWWGGGYHTETSIGIINGNIDIYYQLDSVIPDAVTESATIPNVTIDLTPTTLRDIVPGSVEFIWGGKTYIDRSGEIYTDWDRQTGAANAVGVIDYSTGIISMNEYTGGGNNSLTLKTMLTKIGAWYAYSIYFRTPGAPMRPLSMYFMATKPDGSTIGMTPNGQGEIDTNDAQGHVDYETGITSIEFGRYVLETSLTADQRADFWYDAANIQEDGTIWVPDPVEPTTMKYNAVVYSMMPLDESILGLDPVRLPIDGRVPIVRSGDVGVIHNTKRQELPSPISAGQTVTLARDELAACYLVDQNDTVVDAAQYSTDREAGTITMADPMDLTGLVEPLVAVNRIEDMVLVNEAQINGQITLVGAVERDYDSTDTYFSTALIFNNIASRAHHLFSQSTWTSVWEDTRIGSNTTAQYNDRLYPIQVDNKNAIRERWAIIFTSSSSFNVVGEVSGQIDSGSTTIDCAPINPITGEPYFTILADGWGSGWSTNNVIRFNTDAAHAPIWIARTTISGKPTKEDDSFKLQIRGDAD
ncbi:hypothetical protein Q4508_12600 [Amphritea sp. 2_MG-2023]|uniref:hypothetical protein n=1 Tax=Amphritea TaxID=515417 RepID=UPI001C064EA5|nr:MULTISPECIES: hypothetical protein [Amphritea]MBU2967056.1 hypothetical protein [Amphritea atlantica]MDO6419391.1 hypothetical protein [Amphritea sp. 2_MG-2023]